VVSSHTEGPQQTPDVVQLDSESGHGEMAPVSAPVSASAPAPVSDPGTNKDMLASLAGHQMASAKLLVREVAAKAQLVDMDQVQVRREKEHKQEQQGMRTERNEKSARKSKTELEQKFAKAAKVEKHKTTERKQKGSTQEKDMKAGAASHAQKRKEAMQRVKEGSVKLKQKGEQTLESIKASDAKENEEKTLKHVELESKEKEALARDDAADEMAQVDADEHKTLINRAIEKSKQLTAEDRMDHARGVQDIERDSKAAEVKLTAEIKARDEASILAAQEERARQDQVVQTENQRVTDAENKDAKARLVNGANVALAKGNADNAAAVLTAQAQAKAVGLRQQTEANIAGQADQARNQNQARVDAALTLQQVQLNAQQQSAAAAIAVKAVADAAVVEHNAAVHRVANVNAVNPN